jgi:hypothetical protein
MAPENPAPNNVANAQQGLVIHAQLAGDLPQRTG